MSEKKAYLACFECLGEIVENITLLFPCLRFAEEGFKFPNTCPKKARGVKIMYESRWKEIENEALKNFTSYSQHEVREVIVYGDTRSRIKTQYKILEQDI